MAICSEVHPVAASGLACVVGNDGNRWTTVNREGVKLHRHLGHILPGILLCISVSAAAAILERLEVLAFGRAWLEPLVLAILIGAMTRTLWSPGARWLRGIKFSAKTLLEVAVLLLGCSLSAQTVIAVGPELLGGIAIVVLIAIGTSYGIGKLLGLPRRMATLVACGNSICGNSAIAAIAPVIGADGDEIASSISFTAVLGVIVVLGLPFLVPLLRLSLMQYGVLAGLTVYAVPQVLAATLPIGALSNQIGTVVKLVRVLMLGPVVLGMSLFAQRLRPGIVRNRSNRRWPRLTELVPWFIVGFLLALAARSLGLIPQPVLAPLTGTASLLTTLAMAALGLGVDVRAVARSGARVTLAVTLSLVVLGAMSYALIRFAGIG
jgi:uncharacterized integral membrane protein (TIGR00698 family)